MTDESDDYEFLNGIGGSEVVGEENIDCQQEDFVFDEVSDCFIKLDTGAELAAATVNGMIPKEYWDVVPMMEPGSDEPVLWQRGERAGEERVEWVKPASQLMKNSYGRVVSGRTWWPGRPQIIQGWKVVSGGVLTEDKDKKMFNDYIPPIPVDPNWGGDISMFTKLLLGFNDVDRNDLLDRLAFHIQFPGQKINGILVIHGPQGHGKDSLFFVMNLYFAGLMRTIGMEDLFSKFNNWKQSCIVLLNETSMKDKNAVDLYEALKPISTSPPQFTTFVDKNVKSRQIVNVCSIYVTTNHERALFFEKDDRRVTLLHFDRGEGYADDDFFQRYHDWAKDGGWKAVIHWLSKRDITHFNPMAEARRNESKEAVLETIDNVRFDVIDDVVESFIIDQQEPFVPEEGSNGIDTREVVKPPVILISSMCTYVEKSFKFHDKNGSGELIVNKLRYDRQLPHKMREHGYDPHKVVKFEGKNIRGIYINVKHFEQFEFSMRATEMKREVMLEIERRFGSKSEEKGGDAAQHKNGEGGF